MEQQEAERRKDTMDQVSKLLDIGWLVTVEKVSNGFCYYATSKRTAEELYEEVPEAFGATIGLGTAPDKER
jgi:hypothetical protein